MKKKLESDFLIVPFVPSFWNACIVKLFCHFFIKSWAKMILLFFFCCLFTIELRTGPFFTASIFLWLSRGASFGWNWMLKINIWTYLFLTENFANSSICSKDSRFWTFPLLTMLCLSACLFFLAKSMHVGNVAFFANLPRKSHTHSF